MAHWLIVIIGSSGLLLVASHLFAVPVLVLWVWLGHSEQAPTPAPQRMNGKSSENSFLLGFSCLKKNYLLTTHKPVVSRQVVKTTLTYV